MNLINTFFTPSQVPPTTLLETPERGVVVLRVGRTTLTLERVSGELFEGTTLDGTPVSLLMDPRGHVVEVRSV